jgi:hypothetical protein
MAGRRSSPTLGATAGRSKIGPTPYGVRLALIYERWHGDVRTMTTRHVLARARRHIHPRHSLRRDLFLGGCVGPSARAVRAPPAHINAGSETVLHLSTRILLVAIAGAAIVAGWWILFAINDTGVAVIYSVAWTVAVLVVARILLAAGFSYNRLRTSDTPKADLSDMRDRGVISRETYDAERARSPREP